MSAFSGPVVWCASALSLCCVALSTAPFGPCSVRCGGALRYVHLQVYEEQEGVCFFTTDDLVANYDEVLRAVFYDFTFHSVESVTVE